MHFKLTLLAFWVLSAAFPYSTEAEQKHTVKMVRGGREVADDDARYIPVIALLRRYKKVVDGVMQEFTSICSGTVLHRSCVLTAEHCMEGPGETNLSIEVYGGATMRGKTPLANGKEYTLRPNDDPKLKVIGARDLAILKLDEPLPAQMSYGIENLHDASKLARTPKTLMNIVGYGAVSSNYDEDEPDKAKRWKDVGAGTKRDGDVRNSQMIDGVGPLVNVEPDIGNHSVGPGDSGGPLIAFDIDSPPTIYGVTSYMNAHNLVNSSSNTFASVSYHLPWIKKTLQNYDCTSTAAAKADLDAFIHSNFSDFEHAKAKMVEEKNKKTSKGEHTNTWNKLNKSLFDSIDFKQFPEGHLYTGVKITDVKRNAEGQLVIAWKGYLSENPALEQNIIVRNIPNPSWTPAEGTLTIPKPSRARLKHPLLVLPAPYDQGK